jgi:hypothetical protein
VALEDDIFGSFNDIDAWIEGGSQWGAFALTEVVTVTDGVLDLDVVSLVNNGFLAGFSVHQVDVLNQAPVNLALTGSILSQNAPAGTVVGLVSATDPDGDPITYTVDDPRFTINAAHQLVVAPGASFAAGPIAILLSATDGQHPAITLNTSLTVTGGSNLPPVVTNETRAATEDTLLNGATVLANDNDPEGQPLSVTAGTFATQQGGSITMAANGTFSYAPAADFNGTDSFSYTVSDGVLSSPATLTLNVGAVNDAPRNLAASGATIPSGATAGTVIGTVSASDPEGNPITYGISDPRFTINGANQIVVANGATFPEATVNLVISASDGIAAPVTINKSYQVGNPPPAFAAHYNVGGGAFTAADGTVFTAPPALSGGTQTLRNATTQAVTETTDDALYQTYAFGTFGYDVAVPGAGDYTVTLYLAETFFTAAGARLFDVALEGTVPAAFNDIDVFARTGARWEALELSTTVTVTDGVLDLDVISLINNGLITGFSVVQAGNVVSSNDTATVAEDTATLINVLANDGAGMAITTLNQPLHGTVSVQAGQVLYTPAANYFGTDSFTYTSDDGAGV